MIISIFLDQVYVYLYACKYYRNYLFVYFTILMRISSIFRMCTLTLQFRWWQIYRYDDEENGEWWNPYYTQHLTLFLLDFAIRNENYLKSWWWSEKKKVFYLLLISDRQRLNVGHEVVIWKVRGCHVTYTLPLKNYIIQSGNSLTLIISTRQSCGQYPNMCRSEIIHLHFISVFTRASEKGKAFSQKAK